ncbi:MAG: hypothetical protein IKB83_00260 [Mycoplasmataceae bacterium]|nr:hypothetical protein [Mycoplasmataceae bacterium]
MKKNRILVLSSLVSLIPLASISVVSCNKKKAEEDVNAKLAEALKVFNSNKDIFKLKGTISTVEASTITTEEQLLKYFDFIGKIEGITYTFKKAEPFKNDPTILVVTYELSYKTATKLTGTIYLKGFKTKIENIIPDTPPIPDGEIDKDQNDGTGGGTGGSDGDTGNGGTTTDPTEGILTIRGSQLGATHSDKSVWTHVWTWGSNLSNNIDHYKFYAQKEDGEQVVIPNNYFKVEKVGEGNGYVYFTQRKVEGGEHNELFKWMLEQLGKKRFDAILVEAARDNIKPSNPPKQPTNPDETAPTITTFKLAKEWTGATQERAIVVNGRNLPSNWSKYKLVWKLEGTQQKPIPSEYFRNSIYEKSGYQVFVLKKSAPKEFVEVFDHLLQKQQEPKQFFDLTLVEQTN